MKQHWIFSTLLGLFIIFGFLSSVDAATVQRKDTRVNAEISFNDDKGRGKYKGFNSEYVLQKYFTINGEVSLDEGEFPIENNESESIFKAKIQVNDKWYEAEVYGQEYNFSPGFFEFMEEWDLKKTRTDKDRIKVVITYLDEQGNEQEEVIEDKTITTVIPTAADFCASTRSYMNISAPLSLCDQIQDEKIEKNTENIDQNKEDIQENKENIDENKKSIEENKEDIEKNTEEIEKVKEDVQKIEERVLELDTKVTGLEVKVKEIEDEVDGLKRYVLSFADLKDADSSEDENASEEYVPSELWYREVLPEEEQIEGVSFLEKLFFGQRVHAEGNIYDSWYRMPWNSGSEISLLEGKNYEVFLVSQNEQGHQLIEGYQFAAMKDELSVENTNSAGPFMEKAEDFNQQEKDNQVKEVALSETPDSSNNDLVVIVSMIIGVLGFLILGIFVGFYVANKRKMKINVES